MTGRHAAVCVLALLAGVSTAVVAAETPQNLAPKATISATSIYSNDYQARFVADGVIPAEGSSNDKGKAWCVKGDTHRNGATLTFAWPAPVSVREIVYYGRTSFCRDENWKDYQVLADGKAIAKGQLKSGHGPQRIALGKAVSVKALALKFTSSYRGFNPGASEVRIYPVVPPQRLLGKFVALAPTGLSSPARRRPRRPAAKPVPKADHVNAEALRKLMAKLQAHHGRKYPAAGEHLKRLDALVKAAAAGKDVTADLATLQRDVLLFDVDKLLVIRRHEITASHVYTYHYEGFRAGGALVVISAKDPAKEVQLVASPTGQILDCDLSYDGKTVLFSWRKTRSEAYHLWRVNIDGTGLTQLTDGPKHDYNACWLPDGGIAFLCTKSPQFAYCWHAPVGVVYRMDADGKNVKQLSANYLNDFTPYPLDDGRIIYSRWEYVDKPAIPIQSLWTMNPDGTSLSMYFGNGVLSPGTFMEARSIPGTSKIVCTMTGHNGPTRGAIGVIDRRRGINAQEAIVNITPDTPLLPVNRGNGNTGGSKLYSGPLPLDSIRLILSARGPVLARTFSSECVSTVLPRPAGGMQYLNAQPLRPRPRPPVIASQLDETLDPDQAVIYLQDVYNGLEPYVKHGQVVRIRVVRDMQKQVRIDPGKRAFGFQFPVISCGATYAGKDVLGEVPIAADGSAVFKIPGGMPIYFMALDARGRAVQRMRSFTHLMPGESQGCVGCHEPRLSAGSVSPRASTLYRPPQDIEPPEWGTGGFDYSRIVQPVLDKYCIRCHDPVKCPKGVDLTGGKTDYFNVSYDVLARENQGRAGSPYVNWIPTYNGHEQNILVVKPMAWGSPKSKLAEIVLGAHVDKAGKPRFTMDAASQRRVLAWIDLNVPYYGTSETAYPNNRGCRRLYPKDLDKTLADVARRRCATCHKGGRIPRRVWTRITEPKFNPFLVAPLAKSAGGSETCGRAVFTSADDPDYKAILKTFEPIRKMLEANPRLDMVGGKPAANVCRDTM